MSVQMQFSDAELKLVTELLQMELDELPQELHHSRRQMSATPCAIGRSW